jgi:hypothetical protein
MPSKKNNSSKVKKQKKSHQNENIKRLNEQLNALPEYIQYSSPPPHIKKIEKERINMEQVENIVDELVGDDDQKEAIMNAVSKIDPNKKLDSSSTNDILNSIVGSANVNKSDIDMSRFNAAMKMFA